MRAVPTVFHPTSPEVGIGSLRIMVSVSLQSPACLRGGLKKCPRGGGETDGDQWALAFVKQIAVLTNTVDLRKSHRVTNSQAQEMTLSLGGIL